MKGKKMYIHNDDDKREGKEREGKEESARRKKERKSIREEGERVTGLWFLILPSVYDVT